MTTSSNSLQITYLPTSRDFPEDPSQLRSVLTKSYEEISQAVNRRSIGVFNTFQVVTGNQYYSLTNNNIDKPLQFRQSYRKVFPIGTIAAGVTLTTAHGITGITQFVAIYGTAITAASVNPNGKYIPIPYVSATTDVTFQVQIYANDTNFYIVNGAGADNIVSGTIVLEFLLN